MTDWLDDLEEKARKATPGPYMVDLELDSEGECRRRCVFAADYPPGTPPENRLKHDPGDAVWFLAECRESEDDDGPQMAAYFAALDPSRVLALVEVVKASQLWRAKEAERAVALLTRIPDDAFRVIDREMEDARDALDRALRALDGLDAGGGKAGTVA